MRLSRILRKSMCFWIRDLGRWREELMVVGVKLMAGIEG
jgi:hypothetical protein